MPTRFRILSRLKLLPLLRDRRGATAILTALCATGMIGLAGLAVDVGYWQMQQRNVQGAAEQAAYAAAFYADRLSGSSDDAKTQGKAVAAKLGFVNGQNQTTVTVTNPYNSDSHAYKVTISQVQPTFLSSVVLNSAPTVTASAAAKASTTPTGTMALANSDCKGGLPLPADCDVANALYVNGSTPVNFSGASVISNSSSTSSISVQTGSMVVGQNAYASGGDSVGNNGSLSVSGLTSLNGPPIPDPYANRTAPTGTCPNNCPANSGGAGCNNSFTPNDGSTIQPGAYCGGITVHGSFTMAPGVYVLKGYGNGANQGGNFSTTGNAATITATGVTIYLTSDNGHYGAFSMGQGNILNITAPTSASNGDNQGMAIWIDKTAPTASDTFSSGSTVSLQGAYYAPTQDVTLSGNSGTTATCTQIIARTITFTGGGSFSHNCSAAGISEAVTNATLME